MADRKNQDGIHRHFRAENRPWGGRKGGEDIMKNETRMKHMDAAPRGRAFKVTVSELYQREITVYESEMKETTPEEALRMVENWWQDSQIDLNEADFQGVDYSLTGIMDAPEEMEGGE
jgi:hypothetical protein